MTITDKQRRVLLRCSATFCVGSMLFAPLAARSSHPLFNGEPSLEKVPHIMMPRVESSFPAIIVSRDPFVPLAPSDTSQSLVVSASTSVRAVALGMQPTALVQDGQATRLVGIGDALEGSTIVQIDSTGVTLGNGQKLSLATGG